MAIIDQTHIDLIKLLEVDFGPLPEVADRLLQRKHRRWAESGRSASVPQPTQKWSATCQFEKDQIEKSLILSWLQYRARLIPMRYREVKLSERAKQDIIRFPVIYEIIDQVCHFGDSSPFLSRAIFDRRKSDQSNDPLFSGFQLSHFHLSNLFVTSSMAKGTRDLLYGKVSADSFNILGVFDHNFGAQALLEVWSDSFPDDFIPLVGVIPSPEPPLTFEQLRQMIKVGVNSAITIGDQVCMLKSLGVSTTGQASRIVNRYIQMCGEISNIKKNASIVPACIGLNLNDFGEIEIYDKISNNLLYKMTALE